MKTLITYLLLAASIFAATPDVRPIADGEGSIGQSARRWESGYFDTLFLTEDPTTDEEVINKGYLFSSPITEDVLFADEEGCVADGSTDNYAAVVSLISNSLNKRIVFGQGTYAITVTTSAIGTLKSNCIIEGEGIDNTVLRIDKSVSGFVNIFTLLNTSRLIIRNLTIDLNISNTITSSLFNCGTADNILFENVKLVGNGATNTTDNVVNAFVISSNFTRDTIGFIGCEVTGWSSFILKANSSTGVDSNYLIERCHFYDNVTEHIELNSPLVEMVGLRVLNNLFEDQSTLSAGTGFHLSMSGVSDVIVSGNTFRGEVDGEAIHIENYNRYVIVTDNMVNITCPYASGGEATYGSGIALYENSALGGDGSKRQPVRVIVANNILNGDGSLGSLSGFGIYFESGDGTSPISDTLIEGNIIRDFQSALALYPTSGESLYVADNLIVDCDKGHVNSAISRTYWGQNKYVNVTDNKLGQVEWLSAAPTSGNYLVGDIIWNTVPAASGTVGWVCTTAGTAGSTAVFKTFGTIAP